MSCGPISRPSPLVCGTGSSIEANTEGACDSNCNVVCGGATPVPCPENHCEIHQTNCFSTVVKVQNTWVIPSCGSTAVLSVPDVLMVLPGSYLWNETYGYFEITEFNASTREITIRNNCNEGNAAPGTQVVTCTNFIVTAIPQQAVLPNVFPYVAVDFVAPGDGDCAAITVTTVALLSAGNVVQIGSGQYTIQSIDSASLITICNDGDGITPGTLVDALNAANEYQYPIIVVEGGCCSLEQALEDQSDPSNISISVGETEYSDTALLTVTNSSNALNLNVLYSVEAFLADITVDMVKSPNFPSLTGTFTLQVRLDGGAWTSVREFNLVYYGDPDYPLSPVQVTDTKQGMYNSVMVVAPSDSVTVEARTAVAFSSEANAGGSLAVNGLVTKLSLVGGLGV